jgi:acyl transferase domain-containing protein/acyl carrier protein
MAGNNTWNGLELAVIGMSCRFPGAHTPEEFWRNLRDGIESIRFLSEAELEPSALEPAALRKSPQYVRAAAMIEGAELFDAAFFGISPKEAEVMDPQQRVFLECAWAALESAGYDPERYRERIGVYAGARTNTYVFNLFSNPAAQGMPGAFEVGLGNDLAFLSTRVSHRLNLRGPAYSLHTACSTALVAIHLAAQALTAGECRMALAGGVAIQTPQRTGYPYQPGGVVSPDGHCRAFDAKAQGTLFGNGVGVVVLKRLADALEDGDTIHAVLRGSAINNDGAQKASFSAPSAQGQARVIRDAHLASEVDARSITYVEAHGMGTQLGDPIEVNALTRAFRASTQETGFCALGSVKPNIGHLDAAAGIASFLKVVLALKHRQLPPTLHFETPNPQIDFASSPFFVNAALRDWEPGAHPRRAGVSAFGFGGTNAHVILEEAPPAAPTPDARPWHLLPLSAKTPTALDAATEALAAHLEQHPEQVLGDVAYTLQVGRQAFQHRRIAVVRDREHAIHVLRGGEPERLASLKQEARGRPVAFLFPGMGSQHAHMGAGLYRTEAVFREAADEMAGLLRPLLGLDLRTLLYPEQPHPEEPRLARASLAMPAIFLTEYALARLWLSWGVEPEQMIGHSLGEYAVACIAGVLSVEDAAALVALRGQLMDELPRGSMLSISLPEAQVLPLLGQELDLAAVNAASQCVVSGPSEAVTRLEEELAARGVEHRRLHVETALHSRMLDPILPRFLERVSRLTLRAPERPYISSLTGWPVTAEEVTRPQYWVDHLCRPVRFQQGMQVLLADPARVLLEVGPGQALTALARLQGEPAGARTLVSSARHAQDTSRPDEAVLLNALGQLWLAGVAVDWEGVQAQGSRRRVPLPTYPFEGQRFYVPPRERSAAVAQHASTPGKLPDVADWFHLPSWRRTPPATLEPAALAQTRCWVVFTDDGQLASRLVERLEDAGQLVVTVRAAQAFVREGERRFTVAPDVPEDYAALLRALETLPTRPEVFVHLWSLTPQGERESALTRFQALQPLGYYSLMHLGQALAAVPPRGPVRVEVVSNHLLDPDGQVEALPEKAPLLSACQALYPRQLNVLARGIDVVMPGTGDLSALAGQLLAELSTEPRDPRVALRGARRWVQELSPVRLTETTAPVRPLRERGVYLITGGLGRVGLLLARHLARTKQARLALVGRTPLPPRQLWDDWISTQGADDEASLLIQRVRELETEGSEVLVLSADVSNPLWMREALARVDERFGVLHGVLHCADLPLGSPERGAPEAPDVSTSEARFRAKVKGTYVLEDVLRGRALDFVLLFSSSAAVLAPFADGPSAAANHFLDAFAAHRSREAGTSWVSVAWEPWPRESGSDTEPPAYAMTVDEGLTAFQRVIDRGLDGPVVVATGDVPQRLAAWLQQTASPVQSPASRRPGAGAGEEESQANELERAIAELWWEVLGVEAVGRHADFFALGGDSLLATQLVGRLRSRFQVDLALARLFASPTVAGLAAAVAELQAQRQTPQYRELLERVTRLSEQELAEELRRRGVKAA